MRIIASTGFLFILLFVIFTVNGPSLDQVEKPLSKSHEASNHTTNVAQSDTSDILDNYTSHKSDNENTSEYYLNSKDYTQDYAVGKKSGLDYIPITNGSSKLIPLK